MYAYTGILTALYQRERTGVGAALEVSLFEALGEWMGFPAYYTAYGGQPPARAGASHAAIAPYGPFACGDGRQVFLGIQNSREWARFCAEVLGLPELADDPRFATVTLRVANRAALQAIIEARFAGVDAADVLGRLERAGIANARLNSVQEFWEHPQLRARGRWREVATEVGPVQALLPPVTMAGVEPRMDPVPGLGADTAAILGGLGYGDDELRRLRGEGAV
jgi:crotonobetainyl-CoA:carnitine CoA-transferase CaiB-like acyl-CoA transferase